MSDCKFAVAVLVILVVNLPAVPAQTSISLKTQKGQGLLTEDPSGTQRRITGPIVSVGPGTYEVGATFSSRQQGNEEFEDQFLGRVLVQERTGTGKDCEDRLCWTEILRFTSRTAAPVKTMEVKQPSEWLITSWHLTNTKSRGGQNDSDFCGQPKCWKDATRSENGRTTLELSFSIPEADTVVTLTKLK
jgi:hypothetical protein